MQSQATRDRADAVLSEILSMFESSSLPEAIAQTRVVRMKHDRPLCEWSIGNQLLAHAHGTEDARGYRQWQEVGRHVKKGARAFAILAPLTVKRTEVDEETGEERQRRVVTGFKAIPVFRLEDTEGEPVEYPDYSPPELPPLHEVAERLGVPVRYLPTPSSERGHYSLVRGEIVLGTHDVDTYFHELAHAAHASLETLQGGQNPRQEIIAETVSAVLCRLYGSEGYLAEARDYVAYYAGEEKPERAVMKLLADVERVLDVILAETPEADDVVESEPVESERRFALAGV
jgi:antirestriction protein ArdC